MTAGGAIALSGTGDSTAAARVAVPDTVAVQLGKLSAMVSGVGTLTYRARPDGSPYTVINRARGITTDLPAVGDRIACGEVLYRVSDKPVVLLCGPVPAYRTLRAGDTGRDVRQLNRSLGVRGAGDVFTTATGRAVDALARRRGLPVHGTLAPRDAVFLPEAVRIAKVSGEIGATAVPGAAVLSATSDTLQVQVNVAPSQQDEVKRGDRAVVVLPGNVPLAGRVTGFGRVARVPDGQGNRAVDASIPTFISLDDPAKAAGLDQAPVQVDITTKGVDRALSVPVTALVGRSGGGFSVEVVGAGERRALVAVRPGLFDTGNGRVQVQGRLRAGDLVVVPSL